MVKVAVSAHVCTVKSQRSFERWRAWRSEAEETRVRECAGCPDLILEGTVVLGEECLFPWHLIGGACVMEPLLSSMNGIPWSPFVVQLLNHFWFFVTPWTAARHASLSFTISRSFLIPMSIELVMPSKHFILCHPLLLLPSIFPSIRVFCSESDLQIRWPKYWSFSPSNEYSGLISFKINWFELLAVHGTLTESSPAPQFRSINEKDP